MTRRWMDIQSADEALQRYNDSLASIKVKTDFEVEYRSKEFENIESGHFWADRIKKVRDQPKLRLQIALENLPYPAAFKEAAIALRALIMERKKEKLDYEGLLHDLYSLAVVESYSIPYSTKLQMPGFNVVESTPGGLLFNLNYEYETMGFDKLQLLNKTDKKRMVSLWGEPKKHSTMHEMYNFIWVDYENKLSEQQEHKNDELVAMLQSTKIKQDVNSKIGFWGSLAKKLGF